VEFLQFAKWGTQRGGQIDVKRGKGGLRCELGASGMPLIYIYIYIYDMIVEVLKAMRSYLMMFMNMALYSLIDRANILGNLLHSCLGYM